MEDVGKNIEKMRYFDSIFIGIEGKKAVSRQIGLNNNGFICFLSSPWYSQEFSLIPKFKHFSNAKVQKQE